MRRRALLGAGVVAGAMLLGLLAGEATGWPLLQAPLQRALSQAAGVPVRLVGGFHLRLFWRPVLRVDGLNVGAAHEVPEPHLLDASGVQLAWRWSDLWRWHGGAPLRIARLSADTFDLRLVRLPDGRASWQLGGLDAPPLPQDVALSGHTGLPHFGELWLRRGLIVFDDPTLATQMRIVLHTSEGESLPGSPTTGTEAHVVGQWRALTVNLRLSSPDAMPLLQDTDAAVAGLLAPIRVDGSAGAASVSFDGQAGALLGERRLQGAFRLRGPSLARVARPLGVTLPESPPFDLQGQLGHAGGVWHLQAERAAIGRSLLTGDFDFDTRPDPPLLSGRLNGPRLALVDLGPAIGAPVPGSDTAASAAKPRRVLPQRKLDLPSLRAMDADVQVAIDELDLGSTAIAPLQKLKTRVLLKGGVLHLQALQAEVASGRFSGDTRLDARGEPARWALDLRFEQIDLAGWLRGLTPAPAAGARAETAVGAKAGTPQGTALRQQREQARQGVDQPVRSYLTGLLSGRLQATGAGRSTAEVLASMNGRAQALLRDGTLSHLVTEAAGLDLAEALGVLVRGDQPLPLRCARLDLDIQDGVVRPRTAVVDNTDSTLRIGGQIDLRDESLALQVTTRPKDFSPLTLRSPITVGGTLGAPVLGLQGGAMAGKVLGSLALGVVLAPLAALLPLIDLGSRETVDPCTEQPGTQSAPAAPAASTPQARRAESGSAR